MTRAEQKANEKYPIHSFSVTPKEGEHGEILNFDEWLEDFRIGIQSFSANKGYEQGYEQVEKDIKEWIDEQLTILDKQTLLHPDDDVFWGQRNAYKQMKDKLNSL